MVVRLVKNEPWRLRSSVMAIAFLNILVFHGKVKSGRIFYFGRPKPWGCVGRVLCLGLFGTVILCPASDLCG